MPEKRLIPGPFTNRFPAYALSLIFGLFQALECFPLSLIQGRIPAALQDGRDDFFQHIIGQIYYLQQGWHWPLLMAWRLDAPAGTNIAMTDSIPLEALLLKLVHPLFPDMLQGVTLYLALCWTLQPVCAVFALRSLGEKRLLPALAVAVFSACFPTFLVRLGHAALCGHWILLLAIGLYFRATRPGAGPRAVRILAVLTVLTLLVHPYLMVMTGAILGAVPLTLFLRNRNWKTSAPALIATIASGSGIIILGSVLGYWGGASDGGYGFYSMNLASPFWPVHSSLFPSLPQTWVEATGGQYEGYQYLGAGVLLLLAMVLPSRRGIALLTKLPGQHAGLLLACLALTVIAVSNRVYLFHVPVLLTHFKVPGAEQMRSSGRMFWPVAYLIMLGSVYGLCRAWPRAWPLVLLAGIALQWQDTHGVRVGDHRKELAFLALATREDDQLFSLMRPFDSIEIYPRLECDASDAPQVMRFLYAAARQNALTNTMYTARTTPETACHPGAEHPHPLDQQTLVILIGMSQRVQALRWTRLQHVQCGVSDSVTFCVSPDTPLPSVLSPLMEPAIVPVDRDVMTSGAQVINEEILKSGWSTPESWGVWSETPAPALYLHLPTDIHTAKLVLKLRSTPGVPQRVGVFQNGTQITEWNVQPGDAEYEASLTVSPETHAADLQLQIGNPVHIGQDPRLLGIGLLQFRVHKLN
ncbi:hypothetical protein HKD24_11780 [Gluconobacter sp. LMG 31484]|uniref:Glycosyltransferase RgtA/B/C/D-like domain-containing protein n=1 Tax=Gluconobacter vitians TaxID=2728102 RepID=A0ABR9Y7G9_9PROT|nr:DUF6311 domain-containing protein [Gluconobacter vitians]MBF0859892.1 hypothetical protein [Gluconobacter vitians]